MDTLNLKLNRIHYSPAVLLYNILYFTEKTVLRFEIVTYLPPLYFNKSDSLKLYKVYTHTPYTGWPPKMGLVCFVLLLQPFKI